MSEHGTQEAWLIPEWAGTIDAFNAAMPLLGPEHLQIVVPPKDYEADLRAVPPGARIDFLVPTPKGQDPIQSLRIEYAEEGVDLRVVTQTRSLVLDLVCCGCSVHLSHADGALTPVAQSFLRFAGYRQVWPEDHTRDRLSTRVNISKTVCSVRVDYLDVDFSVEEGLAPDIVLRSSMATVHSGQFGTVNVIGTAGFATNFRARTLRFGEQGTVFGAGPTGTVELLEMASADEPRYRHQFRSLGAAQQPFDIGEIASGAQLEVSQGVTLRVGQVKDASLVGMGTVGSPQGSGIGHSFRPRVFRGIGRRV